MSKKVVKELGFLDDILKALYKSRNECLSIFEIFNRFYRVTPQDNKSLPLDFGTTYPDFDTESLTLDEFFDKHDKLDFKLERLKKALEYLETENMIYRLDNKNYRISFKGIIQYSKSFEQEYKKEIDDRYFNKSTVIVGLIIALFTTVVALFTNC